MESELVSDSFSNKGESESEKADLSLSTYTQVFYDALPQYLAMGMTAEEFWYGDCTLTKSYREAFRIKKELQNESMWLQGMYFYEALCDILPTVVSLGKKKPEKYPKEPYAVTQREIDKRKHIKEQTEYLNMKAKLKLLADKMNQKFKKEEGENG